MRLVIAPQLSSIPLDRFAANELEREVDDLARLFEGYPSSVFLVGGLGLAVSHRRYYRNHRDIDVAVYLQDVERFVDHLRRAGYELRVRRRSFRLFPRRRVYVLEAFDRDRIHEVIAANKRFRAVRRTRSGVLFQRRRTDYFDVLLYERVPGGVRLTDRDVVVPTGEFEPVLPVRDGSPLSVCNPGYRVHLRPNSAKQVDDYLEYGVVPPAWTPDATGGRVAPTAPAQPVSQRRLRTLGRSVEPTGPRGEADQLWLLLAYVMVVEDWQQNGDPSKRGHNIGSLLVDGEGRLVGEAVNSICADDDASRHSEVLLMEDRIARISGRYLESHTLYTTLEPCAMCAGMMTMLRVGRVVYGQSDPEFGGTLVRLRRRGIARGPYPIGVEAHASRDRISDQLDDGYRSGGQQIITYLYSDHALRTMSDARRLLRHHVLRHESNRATLHEVLGHLGGLTSSTARRESGGGRR